MFNLKNIRAGILMSAIVSLFSVNHIFGQSTPTGGNLYGQPVNGSFGGDFDNFFISTPDEIYRNTFQGTFSPIYKHPNGVHFGGTSVSYLGGHKFIVHVFLTNGTILDTEYRLRPCPS